MADYNFKGYANSVIESKISSILSTKLALSRFVTVDGQLKETAGMKKTIHKYTGTGTVDKLARGAGNSNFIDAEYSATDYEVGRVQGQAKWYDDDALKDPKLIEAKIKYLGEGMTNSFTADAITEFNKSENQAVCTDFALANWADAIAKYTNEYEDQTGLFALCSIELVPTVRKALGTYLQYTEDYIRTGALGSILGVPLYASKAVPKDIIFLATKEAVTAFVKLDVTVEQDRDIDKKENFVVAHTYNVVALTDETKCIKMGKAQGTALTATADVSEGTVTGAAPTGAVVTAYKADGTEIGHATASSNTYSISGTIPAAGTEIKVVSVLEGYLPSIKKVETVA